MKFHFHPCDILCIFGRGIELVRSGKKLVWRPTRYIERLAPETRGHPGSRSKNIDAESHDPWVVIAGANANAIAAAHLYAKWQKFCKAPKLVIFAAGRPAYLSPYLEMWEGKPLSEQFLRKVKLEPETRIQFQKRNQNTRDDLLETMRNTQSEGLSSIGIVTVLVHIPRCKEFLRLALKENPSFRELSVHFIPAEHVLLDRHPRLRKAISDALASKASGRTSRKEAVGIEALRSGKYDFGPTGQGYGFSRTS